MNREAELFYSEFYPKVLEYQEKVDKLIKEAEMAITQDDFSNFEAIAEKSNNQLSSVHEAGKIISEKSKEIDLMIDFSRVIKEHHDNFDRDGSISIISNGLDNQMDKERRKYIQQKTIGNEFPQIKFKKPKKNANTPLKSPRQENYERSIETMKKINSIVKSLIRPKNDQEDKFKIISSEINEKKSIDKARNISDIRNIENKNDRKRTKIFKSNNLPKVLSSTIEKYKEQRKKRNVSPIQDHPTISKEKINNRISRTQIEKNLDLFRRMPKIASSTTNNAHQLLASGQNPQSAQQPLATGLNPFSFSQNTQNAQQTLATGLNSQSGQNTFPLSQNTQNSQQTLATGLNSQSGQNTFPLSQNTQNAQQPSATGPNSQSGQNPFSLSQNTQFFGSSATTGTANPFSSLSNPFTKK